MHGFSCTVFNRAVWIYLQFIFLSFSEQNSGISSFYIQGKTINSWSPYLYNDGTTITYFNWSTGQPSGDGSTSRQQAPTPGCRRTTEHLRAPMSAPFIPQHPFQRDEYSINYINICLIDYFIICNRLIIDPFFSLKCERHLFWTSSSWFGFRCKGVLTLWMI